MADRNFPFQRRWPAVVLVLAAAGLAVGLARLPPLSVLDLLAEDLLIGLAAPAEPQHPEIAVVAITEDTLATLPYRSPVDRGFLAELVERLERIPVRAIGIDLLFDQPTEPEKDLRLRDALRTARVPVVAISAADSSPLTDSQRTFLDAFLDGIPAGVANVARDRIDGTVRRHLPVQPRGGAPTPSFPAALAAAIGVRPPSAPFPIAWHGRPDAATPAFPVYPAHLVEVLPPDWLADRIVLVGVVAPAIDRHPTPLSRLGEPTAGVLVQAHTLAQILDGRTHPRVGPALEGAAALLLAGLGVAVALGRHPYLGGAAVLAAFWTGATALYASGGPLVPALAPTLALVGATGAVVGHRMRRERADRRLLMRLFARHVPRPVAEELWRRRDQFMAGGRPRPQLLTATVLFSDIEGFTPISERLAPEVLMAWLEQYLDAMTRVIGRHDGLVLRFIGDGILAAFGVPAARRDPAAIDADAVQAVRCALAMGREIAALNARWDAEGLPAANVRVGIHTGPLVAGSVGSHRHLEYSLFGDTVNVAARLEALARSHARPAAGTPCSILAGGPTWEAVERAAPGAFDGTAVGRVELKGKSEAIAVWCVSGHAGAASGPADQSSSSMSMASPP